MQEIGVVEQGVVVPVLLATTQEGGLVRVHRPPVQRRVAGVVAQAAGQQVPQPGDIGRFTGNFQGVVQHLHRDVGAVATVGVMARLGPDRPGRLAEDPEVANPGRLDVPGAGPPGQRLVIMVPAGGPVTAIANLPLGVPQGFLDLGPEQIPVLFTAHLPCHGAELLQRSPGGAVVRIVGGGP